MNSDTVTTNTAARILKASVSLVKKLIKSGNLQATKQPARGGYKYIINKQSLQDYIAQTARKQRDIGTNDGNNSDIIEILKRQLEEKDKQLERKDILLAQSQKSLAIALENYGKQNEEQQRAYLALVEQTESRLRAEIKIEKLIDSSLQAKRVKDDYEYGKLLLQQRKNKKT